MQRHKGFAPIAALVVLAMLIAQCDVRYASGAVDSHSTYSGGTP
jgi:hypothetical protein